MAFVSEEETALRLGDRVRCEKCGKFHYFRGAKGKSRMGGWYYCPRCKRNTRHKKSN